MASDPSTRVWISRVAGLLFAGACAGAMGFALSSGCNGWTPLDPFERNSPEVDEALQLIDAGAFESAGEVLTRYLGTGVCEKGNIGLPDTVRDKYDGSFDLGLVLFHIAEKFGRPFGEEETGEAPSDDPQAEKRSLQIDCALIIVKAIASDPKVPIELRARARYLAGNLEFLRRKYEEAVEEYDQALALVPGIAEDAGGDGIGRDAAWNRAIALRRIQDQKDAGPDSDAPDSDDGDAPDSPDSDDAPDGDDGDANDGDANDDASDGDAGNQPPDGGEDGGQDAGGDAGQDAGGDAGGPDDEKEEPTPGDPEPAEPKDPHAQQQTPDDRILDRLEEAPSYQEEEAKKRAAGRRRVKMEDK